MNNAGQNGLLNNPFIPANTKVRTNAIHCVLNSVKLFGFSIRNGDAEEFLPLDN